MMQMVSEQGILLMHTPATALSRIAQTPSRYLKTPTPLEPLTLQVRYEYLSFFFRTKPDTNDSDGQCGSS